MTPRSRYVNHCLADPGRLIAAYRLSHAYAQALAVTPAIITRLAQRDFENGYEGMAVHQDVWDRVNRSVLTTLAMDILCIIILVAFVAAVLAIGMAFAP